MLPWRGLLARAFPVARRAGGRRSFVLPAAEQVAVAQLAASMPQLAGKLLEPPRFHQAAWEPGQQFSEQDDPDRTKEPWHIPSFLQRAAEQGERAWAEDLPIHEELAGAPRGAIARLVHNVLDEAHCAELIACANRKGFTPALVNIGHGMQQLLPDLRDGHRVIFDSPELTRWLFEVLHPHLPEQLRGAHLVELNERCRILCYTPGQEFSLHRDGRYLRPATHANTGDRSMVTVQLYLNEVPEDCGGATTFQGVRNDSQLRCQPRAGSVLLFTQDLLHEGSRQHSGIKYVLRTEAMYRQGDWPYMR